MINSVINVYGPDAVPTGGLGHTTFLIEGMRSYGLLLKMEYGYAGSITIY